MSQAQRPERTLDRFLLWEAGQSVKWGFDGVRPVPMTGGSWAHPVIQGNIVRMLNNRLAGRGCRAAGPDFKLQTASGIRYPGAFVTCAPVASAALMCDTPVVIFEVLSPSTASADRTTKIVEFRAIASLQRYVMLEQDRMFATVVSRHGDVWNHALLGPDAVLPLPEIGVELPVAELYDGLALDLVPEPER